MPNASEILEERANEIESYLDFVDGLDSAIKGGVPRIGTEGPSVSVGQQRIINSGVYLQLYNLIEATVSNCLEEISKTAMQKHGCKPADLNESILREWVRNKARTHVSLSPANRLEESITFFEYVASSNPIEGFEIEKGSGGNWDDTAIEKIVERVGCDFDVSTDIKEGVKRHIRDDLGAMSLVVTLRNKLAHGSLSFSECGQYDTAAELRDLYQKIVAYLRALVSAVDSFISNFHFLKPNVRPTV